MNRFFSDQTVITLVRDLLNPATWEGACVYATVLVFSAIFLARGIRLLAGRALVRSRNAHLDRTVVQFLTQLAQVVIWIIALMVFLHIVPALQKLGTALLAGVSVVSVVIGLAAQSTLSNFIAGCSLVLYRPFEVDDQIEIAGPGGVITGIIERLTLGYTMLRTFDDRRIIVPNSLMASQITVSGNRARLRALATVPVAVPQHAHAARVQQFLMEQGSAHPGVVDVVACLEEPMEPQGMSLSLRLWCRDEDTAITATNDIVAAVAKSSARAGIDVLVPAPIASRPKDAAKAA